MDNDRFCLSCSKWNQHIDDRSIGGCRVHGGYRFQYETCSHWRKGEARIAYRESAEEPRERNRSHDDAIEQLMLSGNTVEETRKILHCSATTVREVVAERNLEPVVQKSGPKVPIISGDEYDKVVYYYEKEKMSRYWIAKKLGYTESAVRGALVRAGLAS